MNFRKNRYKQGCKPLSGGTYDQINTQRPENFASLAVGIALGAMKKLFCKIIALGFASSALPGAPSPADTAEMLKQRLLRAYQANDASAAQELLCVDGAAPEIRDMYKKALAFNASLNIRSAVIERAGPLQPGESYVVAPEGLLRLTFKNKDKSGERNFRTSSFYYFGQVNGRYCFLVPRS